MESDSSRDLAFSVLYFISKWIFFSQGSNSAGGGTGNVLGVNYVGSVGRCISNIACVSQVAFRELGQTNRSGSFR